MSGHAQCADSHVFFFSVCQSIAALQDSGLIQYEGQRPKKNVDTETDAFVEHFLEVAKKKKKFRFGGKLVALVTEVAFLSNRSMGTAATTPTTSSGEDEEEDDGAE